ncbi:MAG TPA: AbrB/MazE/SpoVT family DNA-binding domain-containing protein [bacterium]|jgi:AbrB family looped-hinge helix DNA binding protein|nr:AbrB/MazE/SpoVT family DNA-binding domain-containing protein [bacterium]
MLATISSKGQVTIPKAIREALGLKSGDSVAFAVKDGAAVLRPVRARTMDDLQACLRMYADKGPDIRHGHREALAEALCARKRKWFR